MARAEEAVAAAAREGEGGGILAAMRPRQWTKNLLLFVGLLFAAEFDDPVRWAEAIAAFVAYCAASSAASIFDDVRDAPQDRLHPLKRSRPVASGALRPDRALKVAAMLAIFAIAIASWFGWVSLAYMAGFLALEAAYSLGLERVVLIDVLTIAALYVIRAAAGADAVDASVSSWLVMCTGLLGLFLALGNRRGELATPDAAGRPPPDCYSLALVDPVVSIAAVGTIVAYSLYAFTARDSWAMAVTIPFVVFGVIRYLRLLRRDDLGEEPEIVFLSDVPILATTAAWAVTSALVVGLT
jgi:4-hydroxybenzoate polyprenyltransferase